MFETKPEKLLKACLHFLISGGGENAIKVTKNRLWGQICTRFLSVLLWWQFYTHLCRCINLWDHEMHRGTVFPVVLMTVFVSAGEEGRANIEVIILVCTGAAATFLWLMLILFIRKLRKVRLPNLSFHVRICHWKSKLLWICWQMTRCSLEIVI